MNVVVGTREKPTTSRARDVCGTNEIRLPSSLSARARRSETETRNPRRAARESFVSDGARVVYRIDVPTAHKNVDGTGSEMFKRMFG